MGTEWRVLGIMKNEPMVSTQIVLPVVENLREAGVCPDPLLETLGIDRDGLSDVDALVPLRKYVQFFELAADASRNSHFGLAAGKAIEVSTGPISFLFLSAPTLANAFAGLCDYLRALQDATECRLLTAEGKARFVYRLLDESIAPRRQDSEYSIAATCRLISNYIGRPFVPSEIWFEHARVGNQAHFETVFNCHVFFGQDTNAVVFEPELLMVSAPSMSRKLYPIIASHLRGLVNSRSAASTFAEQIGDLIDQSMLARGVTAGGIAELLGVSESTLSRRLRSEGTSFMIVLTNKRMAIAKRLLNHTEMPIAEIALSVGYAENASFSRAFKAWSGQTPENFRSRRI